MHPSASRTDGDNALLLRARRMAQRSRASTACIRCKSNKVRCSDYRPCSRCRKAGATSTCMDLQSAVQHSPSASPTQTCKKISAASMIPGIIQSPSVNDSFDRLSHSVYDATQINWIAWSQSQRIEGGEGSEQSWSGRVTFSGGEHQTWAGELRRPNQDEQACGHFFILNLA